jgi:hypothetical protein
MMPDIKSSVTFTKHSQPHFEIYTGRKIKLLTINY